MGIYRGTAPLKAYKGDMQPVNVYRGSTKVAGWHSASYSGASPLTVDCDYNVPPDALVIDGKCVQSTTTGKNLLPSAQSQTINGITFTQNSDGSIIANGTASVNTDFYFVGSATVYASLLGAGDYKLSGCTGGSASAYMLYVVKKNSSGVVDTYIRQIIAGVYPTINVSNGDTFRVFIRVLSGVTVYNQAFHQQIELGSAATSYEPYTGGIPSPNPSYPQPISTITGDVGITGADGAASDTATVAFGSAVCASLPDGTHDSYDAVTGVLTKNVGFETLLSTDEWKIRTDAYIPPSVNGICFRNGSTPEGKYISNSICYCNRLTSITTFSNGINTIRLVAAGGNGPNVIMDKSAYPDVDSFRAWLATNPVTVYYKLATPTIVQLTPHLPVVRTGIKTLSISADVVPTLSATVKSMD